MEIVQIANALTQAQCLAMAQADYNAVRGQVIAVSLLVGYKDDGSEAID